MTLTHGILASNWAAVELMKTTWNEIESHPEVTPNSEPREVWVDRTNHKPKPKKIRYSPVCGRGLSVYKERWR